MLTRSQMASNDGHSHYQSCTRIALSRHYLISLLIAFVMGSAIVSGAEVCLKFNPSNCKINMTSMESINQSISNCTTYEYCNTSQSRREHCIALFRKNNSYPSGYEPAYLSCWENSDGLCSDDHTCPLYYHDFSKYYRCCCKENYCNRNYLELLANTTYPMSPPRPTRFPSTTAPTTNSTIPTNPPSEVVVMIVVPITSIIIVVLLLIYWMRRRCRQSPSRTREPAVIQMDELKPESYHIELIDRIGYGAYGSVWRSKLTTRITNNSHNATGNHINNNNDTTGREDGFVAVKILSQQRKSSWEVEREIYTYLQPHPHILHFIMSEKRRDDEYWLVTEFHPAGSLHNFLKENDQDWNDSIKLAQSVADGLAYLHLEGIGADGELLKPSIAHRDFKSKNVLVKADRTCCIADFGLAVKFDAHSRPADIHAQVGTFRYMSPEVLDGAISFHRESFLRIDVYALALVLWEIMSRSSVSGKPGQEYRLPFEEELGKDPSLVQMQTFVAEKKLRPKFCDQFHLQPRMEAVKETIEECWDDDAEARLTAGCVSERLVRICEQSSTDEHYDNISPIQVDLPPKSEESTV